MMPKIDYLEAAEEWICDLTEETAEMQSAVAQAFATMALVEERRRTNELLTAALWLARDAIMFDGDVSGLDDVLGQFIQHPRDPSLEVG